MRPVDSSNIAAIGYHEPDQTLAVAFKSGAIFHYRNVDVGLYERFLEADSLGSFFYYHIKGRYPADKMTGKCPECGDGPGPIGERCDSCGCNTYHAEEKRYSAAHG